MKKSALLRTLLSLIGLTGTVGAVASPMMLNSRNSKSPETVSEKVDSNITQVNQLITNGNIDPLNLVNEIDSTISSSTEIQKDDKKHSSNSFVSGPDSSNEITENPQLKKYEGFDQLGGSLKEGFTKKNKAATGEQLPGKEDLKRVFLKDGEVSGEGILSREEGEDCRIGETKKTAYCGFFELKHKGNSYKIKVGFNGNHGNDKKKRGEIVVVKQIANDKPTWYSAQTGGGQTCVTDQGKTLVETNNRSGCENWKYTDHFNGKERESSNFGGNLRILSAAKTIQ